MPPLSPSLERTPETSGQSASAMPEGADGSGSVPSETSVSALPERVQPERLPTARLRSNRPVVTMHALRRFRCHHPEASNEDLGRELVWGITVAPGLAMAMVGRPTRVDSATGDYVLAPSRRGLFVIREHIVITYLRFEHSQQEFAERHWPTSSGPTNDTAACHEGPETSPSPPPYRPSAEKSFDDPLSDLAGNSSQQSTTWLRAELAGTPSSNLSNREISLLQHPHLPINIRAIQVSDELRKAAGSHRLVRVLLLDAELLGSAEKNHHVIHCFRLGDIEFKITTNLWHQTFVADLAGPATRNT